MGAAGEHRRSRHVRRARAGSVVGLLLVVAAVVLVTLLGPGPGSAPSSSVVGTGHVPAGTLDAATARAALDALRVAPRGSMAGYERSCAAGSGCVFGPSWADVDGNGCDQRDDVLARDLTDVRRRAGSCVVVEGTLADPYTGRTVTFSKSRADQVQIDHVVPLAAAWGQGAARWTADRRKLFANDPGNLIATTAGPNESKGDDTADAWTPPNSAFDCAYGRVVVTVKQRYGLTVTAAEAAALRRLLAAC